MRTTDGDRIIDFAERFCRHTRGSLAGQLIELRDWQKDVLRDLAQSGARRGFYQTPRKSSKSLLGSILCLYNLAADGEDGAEVYSVAGSREQAGVVFNTARRMVELDPSLRRHLLIRQYDILHKASGSRYKALASDAGTLEGLSPHFCVFDECHVLGSDDRIWNVMSLACGTREAPLLLGITTPGTRYGSDGRDSHAWTLYDYGKRLESGETSDPHFWFRCYEAPAGCAPDDRRAWAIANPGLGDFLAVDDMESAFLTTPEAEFVAKRLGRWTHVQTAWLPYGSWAACACEYEAPAEQAAAAARAKIRIVI